MPCDIISVMLLLSELLPSLANDYPPIRKLFSVQMVSSTECIRMTIPLNWWRVRHAECPSLLRSPPQQPFKFPIVVLNSPCPEDNSTGVMLPLVLLLKLFSQVTFLKLKTIFRATVVIAKSQQNKVYCCD